VRIGVETIPPQAASGLPLCSSAKRIGPPPTSLTEAASVHLLYILNNPLAGRDPTGYAIEFVGWPGMQFPVDICRRGPFHIGCGGYSGSVLFPGLPSNGAKAGAVSQSMTVREASGGASGIGALANTGSVESAGLAEQAGCMLFNSVCEFGERGEPGTWGDDVVGGGKELYNAAVGLARLGEIVQNPLTALAPSVFPSRVPAPVAISDRELGGAAIVNAALAFVPSSIAARLRAPLSAGMRLPEGGVAAKGTPGITKEVLGRKALGADGAKSVQIIERENGKMISRTHEVTKDGKVIHQHQNHTGKHGGERQFPEEWTGTKTINAPYENIPPSFPADRVPGGRAF
jgi:hypothetical protein